MRALLLALALAALVGSGVWVGRSSLRQRVSCPDSFVADPGALPATWRAAPASPLGDVAPFAVTIRTGPTKPLPELESAELSTPDTCGQQTFALQFPHDHARADSLAGTLHVRYLPPLYVISSQLQDEEAPLLVLRREPSDARRAKSPAASLRIRLAIATWIAAVAGCIQAFRTRNERRGRFAVALGLCVVGALTASVVARDDGRSTDRRSTPTNEVTLQREPMPVGGSTRMTLQSKIVFTETTDSRVHGPLVRHRSRTRNALLESRVTGPTALDIEYLSEKVSNGFEWIVLDEPSSLTGRKLRLLGTTPPLGLDEDSQARILADFAGVAQFASSSSSARVGDRVEVYDGLLRGLVGGQLNATVFGHPVPEQTWDVRLAAPRGDRAELALELKTLKPSTMWGSSLSLKGELTITLPGGRPVSLRLKGNAYNGFGTMAGPVTNQGTFELSVQWTYP